MSAPEVWFPHIGIKIGKLDPVAFKLFGISVYWYGIIIGLAVTCGLLLAMEEAKRTNQDPNYYVDFYYMI